MRAVLRRRNGWPQPRSRNGGNRCVVLGASTDTVRPVSYNRKRYPGGSWLARISQRRWGLRFPEYAPQGSASRPRLPAPGKRPIRSPTTTSPVAMPTRVWRDAWVFSPPTAATNSRPALRRLVKPTACLFRTHVLFSNDCLKLIRAVRVKTPGADDRLDGVGAQKRAPTREPGLT